MYGEWHSPLNLRFMCPPPFFWASSPHWCRTGDECPLEDWRERSLTYAEPLSTAAVAWRGLVWQKMGPRPCPDGSTAQCPCWTPETRAVLRHRCLQKDLPLGSCWPEGHWHCHDTQRSSASWLPVRGGSLPLPPAQRLHAVSTHLRLPRAVEDGSKGLHPAIAFPTKTVVPGGTVSSSLHRPGRLGSWGQHMLTCAIRLGYWHALGVCSCCVYSILSESMLSLLYPVLVCVSVIILSLCVMLLMP